jgi:hypothetical protein
MKSYFHVRDGLRDTAAFSVFLFHIWELLVPSLEQNPMAHTFLAVDFFFAHALSRWYDRPVRAWSSRACLERTASPAMPNTRVPRIESRGTNH